MVLCGNLNFFFSLLQVVIYFDQLSLCLYGSRVPHQYIVLVNFLSPYPFKPYTLFIYLFFYLAIRSSFSLLSCRVGSLKFDNLSSYDEKKILLTCYSLFYVLPIFLMFYTFVWLTIRQIHISIEQQNIKTINILIISSIYHVIDALIFPTKLYAFTVILFICSSGSSVCYSFYWCVLEAAVCYSFYSYVLQAALSIIHFIDVFFRQQCVLFISLMCYSFYSYVLEAAVLFILFICSSGSTECYSFYWCVLQTAVCYSFYSYVLEAAVCYSFYSYVLQAAVCYSFYSYVLQAAVSEAAADGQVLLILFICSSGSSEWGSSWWTGVIHCTTEAATPASQRARDDPTLFIPAGKCEISVRDFCIILDSHSLCIYSFTTTLPLLPVFPPLYLNLVYI